MSTAQAEQHVRDGRPDLAEAVLTQAQTAGALTADGAAMLARLLHNRAVSQDDDDAEALLLRALDLDPALAPSRQGLVGVRLRRALTALQSGAMTAAAAAVDSALAIGMVPGSPGLSDAAERLHVAALAHLADDPLAACRLAMAAWALDSAHYPTARSLHVHLGTGELGRPLSEDECRRALAETGGDAVALVALANLDRRAGRQHRAEALYRQAAALRPALPFAAARLAALLAEQRRFAEASALFQTVGAAHGGLEQAIRLDRDFLAALTTAPPPVPAANSTDDFVVYAGCDSGYFRRFSAALVNSLAASGARARLHFHIVDADSDALAHLDRLRLRHPALTIDHSAEPSPPHFSAEQRRTFYACARFLHLPDLLRLHGRPVLMVDVDLVMLRDPTPLVERLRRERADIALTVGSQRDPWCELWADAVLAAPSTAAIAALDRVRAYIRHFLDRGLAPWFLDQVALFAALVAADRLGGGPALLPWPQDIQNGDAALCHFWSLHSSQPNNQGAEHTALYRRFAEDSPP